MNLGRVEVYIITFLGYSSISAIRSCYSATKKDINQQIDIDIKYMGLIDALMIAFLGLGHFLHAVYPVKKPVRTLWTGMLLCAVNYSLIPVSMATSFLRNVYILSIIMCINGYLQSFTWPNQLMLVNSKFDSQKNSTILGFWASAINVGSIIGMGIYSILGQINSTSDDKFFNLQFALSFCAIFCFIIGLWVFFRFDQLPIAGSKDIKQTPVVIYDDNQFDNPNNGESAQQISQKFLSYQGQNKLIGSQKDNLHLTIDNLFSSKSMLGFSKQTNQKLKQIDQKIKTGQVKDIRIIQEPEKVSQTPLTVMGVFRDPNIMMSTLTMALVKSVIFGLMLWLPLYFQQRKDLEQYSGLIPITNDVASIFGSVGLGFLFRRVKNKGLLMIPFMIIIFVCFLLLKFINGGVAFYFIMISINGFCLGGIFNTLCGLVLVQLTKVIPQNLKASSLGFYSALTMSVANFTTAFTQILIGFVIGKQDQEGIFLVFTIYAAGSFVFLTILSILTIKQHGFLSKGKVLVIQQVRQDTQQVQKDLPNGHTNIKDVKPN